MEWNEVKAKPKRKTKPKAQEDDHFTGGTYASQQMAFHKYGQTEATH